MAEPVRTAWYPSQRSGMLMRNQTYARAAPMGLTQMQKVWIGVGTTAGILVVIGIILGAVLGTQLKNEGAPFVTTTNYSETTQVPPTTAAPMPDVSNDVLLNTAMTLDNVDFTDDLKDPNSAAYKDLANRVCEELKMALPQDEIDSVNCTDIEFSSGSVKVILILRVVVKQTVKVSMINYANMVQTLIRIRFTKVTSIFKAIPDTISFKNLKICNPNPCKYSGRCIDSGGGEFKCQCKPGKYGKTCDDELTFCSCSGDTHCKTYDRLAIDYQGTCKFILSQATDKSFTVYLRNINLKGITKVSWARYAELSYNNLVVRIGKLDPYNLNKPIAAWVNNVPVNLPFQNSDLNIYKTGDTIVCKTNQGMMISYGNWQARVGLLSSLKNKVTGLCGNFDGNKNNDATTNGGENVLGRRNFGNTIGNSYVVGDNENQPYSSSCKLSDDDVANPTCAGVDLRKALFLCQQIKDAQGKFKACVSAMRPDDISDFNAWCEYDVRQTCDVTAATLAVTIFVQSCFEFDPTLVENVKNWKEEFNITKDEEFDNGSTCTGGKVRTTSGCENTCSNRNATMNCDLPDVVGSCSCPAGTVSFKDVCVEPSRCGCTRTDGSAYFIGDSWLSADCSRKFTCSSNGQITDTLNRCQSGKTCSESKCLACSPTNPCQNGGLCTELDVSPGFSCRCAAGYSGSSCSASYATCQGYGDAHYKTFDDLRFDYQGTRKYRLGQWRGDVQTFPFTIFGKNVNLKSSTRVSYVYYVELRFKNMIIRLTKAYKSSVAPIVVNVNYDEVEVPYEMNNITISRKGNSIELNNGEGLLLTFGIRWEFKVKLSPYFFDKSISGLCGNFDGAANNDKTKADGSVASGSNPFIWGRELGDSFVVNDDPEDDEKLPTPTNPSPPQCDTTALNLTCNLISSPSGPFSRCLSKVPQDEISQRVSWCLFDVQWTCDVTSAWDSFSLFSDVCAEAGVIVDWRSVLKQPCKCSSDDLTCYPVAPTCIPSCQDPQAAEKCQLPLKTDVCACPAGKLLFKGKCIIASECGCIDDRGMSHEIGDVWLTQNCRAFKCVGSNVIQPLVPPCPVNTICRSGKCVPLVGQCTNAICDTYGGRCVLNQNGNFSCKCNPGFNGNRCQYREAKCYCQGDIHCNTFDGIHIDYQGLCRFVMVNSTDRNFPFTVYGKNVVRFQKFRVSWILYVEIYYNGSKIKIGRETAEDTNINTQVDGSPVTATPASFQGFQVYSTGDYNVFQSQDKRLQVFVGKSWTVKIIVVRGSGTEGFCGNNNMLRSDDYKLKNGTILSDVNVQRSGKLIGDSYVDDTDLTCLQPQPPTPPSPCPVSQTQTATKACAAISDINGVFSICQTSSGNQSRSNYNLDPDQTRLWCEFDFAETCQISSVEIALSAFATLCIEEVLANENLTIIKNVTFNSTYFIEKEFQTDIAGDLEILINFRAGLNITKTCDILNSVYSPRSSGCPATCRDPSAPVNCILPDVFDSCVCPRGFLFFGGRCIQPNDCGCVYNNSARPVGDSWLTDRCTVRRTCVKIGDGIPSIVNTTSQSCPIGKQCTAENTCSACRPLNPCRNGAECVEATNSSQNLYFCKCPTGFAGNNCEVNIGPPGWCYSLGNGHLVTFDGLPLNFKSYCGYFLLQFSTTIVKLQTLQVGNARTMNSYLEYLSPLGSISILVEPMNASMAVYLNTSILIEPPYQGTNFTITYFGEYIRLDVNGSLTILFNEVVVAITLPTSFKGKVKGMCGNYNDVISDDLMTSSGRQLPLLPDGTAGVIETRDVGNTYLDANVTDVRFCNLPEQPPRPPCPYEVSTFEDTCREFLNPQGPLRDCMSHFTALILNQTLRWCLSDVRDTCDVTVAAVNILFIYDVCLRFRPLPPICDLLQTEDLNCQCTKPNTTFAPRTTACTKSCKNRNQPSECKEADLMNTCVCREGFLLLRGKCVPTQSCGCIDERGTLHQVGETWLNRTCTAKYTCNVDGSIGQERITCNKTCINSTCTACTRPNQCLNGKCFDTNNNPGYFCKCSPGYEGTGIACKYRNVGYCSAYGDTHYKTFDGLYFDYQGVSKFLLMESLDPDLPIRILTKNFYREAYKVSWLDYVEIEFKGRTYRAQRKNNDIYSPIVVKLNGSDLAIPFTSNDGSFNISFDGDAVRLNANIGVAVMFMPMFRANIEVDYTFRAKLRGACGNFDGIKNNDFIVDGKDFSKSPDPGNALGNYFVVDTGAILSPDMTPSYCDAEPSKRSCRNIGNSTGPFADCLKEINPDDIQAAINNCLFDLDQTCSVDTVQIAYLTFARRCYYSLGTDIGNAPELQCDCKEPNTVCMAKSTGCPATCSNPSSPDTCPLSDSILVCACASGRLLFNGRCVLPVECGCVYIDGRVFNIGESWLSEDCQMRLTCRSPNVYTSDIYRCPTGKTCVSGACRACSANTCNGNGQCVETNTTVGYVCKCDPRYYGPNCANGLISAYYENTHCTTFDVANFDYVGVGLFLLVKSTKVTTSDPIAVPFEIWVANVYTAEMEQVSYAKLVIIIIMNYQIVIDREGESIDAKISVKVNGVIVEPPYKTNLFDIIANGPTSVTFVSTSGVICSYNSYGNSVIVSLPALYKASGVSGMCGNFDGNEANDYVTKDGRNVSNANDAGFQIGYSYTNTSSPFYRNITSFPRIAACDNYTLMADLYIRCHNLNLTEPYSPFFPVLKKLGAKALLFTANCFNDANKFCTYDAMCYSVQRFVRAAEIAFEVNWRKPFGCEVKCPNGFEYRPQTNACPASCTNPSSQSTCSLPDVTDGCSCPPSKLMFKYKCVDRTQCGCIDNSTMTSYEIGQSWRNVGCVTKSTCGAGGIVTQENIGGCSKGRCGGNKCSGCLENPCRNNGTCVDTSEEGDYVCRCPVGYYGRRCDGQNTEADITILIENGISECNGDATCAATFTQGVKDFLKNLVRDFVIGPQDIRVSVATFISDVTLVWPLQQYTTSSSILNAIDQNLTLSSSNQQINLRNSIDSVIKLITSSDNNLPGRLKVLILITNGGSDIDASVAPTMYKKLVDAGIMVCAVGMSASVKVEVLKTICSLPKQIDYNYFLYIRSVNVTALMMAIRISKPITNQPLRRCSCYSDPHCLTFDDQAIDYQGTCKIEFVSNKINASGQYFPPFSVFLKSVNRNYNLFVSWPESIYVDYMGTEVKLTITNFGVVATVRGNAVDVPYSNANFTISIVGNGLEFKAIGWDLYVYCGSDTYVYVKIPYELSNKVNGFCGNFDGRRDNDLVTKSGIDVSRVPNYGKDIGDSYIALNDPENGPILPGCRAPTGSPRPCTGIEPFRNKCRQLTDITGTFKNCISVLSTLAQKLRDDCLFDLENTCNITTIEVTIALFAKSCNDAGVFIESWRETLNLPCRCPSDKICLPRGSPCLPTVQNPDARQNCPLPDTTDICTCRPGEVVFNGNCQRLEATGCSDANGRNRNLKEAWLSDDCQLLYNCSSSGTITSESVSCPPQSTCINGKCSGCQVSPCQNGGLCSERTECQRKTSSNPGCYWKRVPYRKNIVTTISPQYADDLNTCIQACITSTSSCAGINWIPFARRGEQCLLVSSLSIPDEPNYNSTQYLWVCSDTPCPVGPADDGPKLMYSCECKNDFSGNNCEEKKIGRCVLNAGLLFKSFDGTDYILFRTNCKTTLAKSKDIRGPNQFTINIKNSLPIGRNSIFFIFRMIEVEFRGKKIKIVIPEIGLPKILLQIPNGQSFLPLSPPLNTSDFSLSWRGNFLTLQTSFGLAITVGSFGNVRVHLSSEFAGRVEGMCGDFDGNPLNDKNISSLDPGYAVTQKYFVPDDEYTVSSNCSLPELTLQQLNISINTSRCNTSISLLGGYFDECLQKLDFRTPAGFDKICFFELVFNLIENGACIVLHGLADWCSNEAGVTVSSNWRSVLYCPCACGNGFNCDFYASSCPNTCSAPNAYYNCSSPYLDSLTCVCPYGQVLFNDRCVLPEHCGCLERGIYSRAPVEQWLNEDCTILYKCHGGGNISSSPNICPQNSTCNNSVCSVCSANNPCKRGTCIDSLKGKPVCRCPPGYVGENCEIDNLNTCMYFANGHCLTFDGLQLDYMGGCQVILAESIPPLPHFKITGRLQRIGNISYPGYVQIDIGGEFSEFRQPVLSQAIYFWWGNFSGYNIPMIRPTYMINYRGQTLVMQTRYGLSVSFLDGIIKIDVPQNMSGSVRGFCGNFNNDKSDDMTTLGGRGGATGQEVADSYVILEYLYPPDKSCIPMEPRGFSSIPPSVRTNTFMNSSTTMQTTSKLMTTKGSITVTSPFPLTTSRRAISLTATNTTTSGASTTTARASTTSAKFTWPPISNTLSNLVPLTRLGPLPQRFDDQQLNETCPFIAEINLLMFVNYCEEMSNSSGIFGGCLQELNKTMPHIADKMSRLAQNCKNDLFASCEMLTVYYYLKFLASTCSEIGFTIDWINAFNAYYICEGFGSTYSLKQMSACPATCQDPDVFEICPWNDMGGFCVCDPGYVIYRGSCMRENQCGCYSSSGSQEYIGNTWFEDNCYTRKTCIGPRDTLTERGNGSCIV